MLPFFTFIIKYGKIIFERTCKGAVFMNTYRIKIFNRELNITTDETFEYTRALADRLNAKLSEITSGIGNLTLNDAAVLVSLDCLDKAVKSEESAENIRQQIKEYADDASAARQQVLEKENEIAKLTSRIKELEEKLSAHPAQTAQKSASGTVFVPRHKEEPKQNFNSQRSANEQTSFFKK